MKLSDVFGGIFIVLAGIAGIFWVLWYFSLPVVLVDSITGECVKVVAPGANPYNCRLLPMKYTIERVAPYSMRGENDDD